MAGRPKKYKAEDIAKRLDKYIEDCEDPMIQEFCLLDGVSKDTIYRLAKECVQLSDTIKKCHAKQEIRTVRKVQAGEMNPTWAIFKMKQRQYGWTDKQEIELDAKVENKVVIVDDI